MHLFTYGTLMFPEVWQAVVGRSFAAVRGRADGYQIFRVRDVLYPGIIAGIATHSVRGVVYFDVDDESIARLDRFESDFYERRPMEVVCDDGECRDAHAYIVPTEHRDVLTAEPWNGNDFAARGDLARFIAGFAGFGRV
jgi:gamma-glutamylcyclotransferase (GGCT)/AIG2-like uncharacterized protein YtfP